MKESKWVKGIIQKDHLASATTSEVEAEGELKRYGIFDLDAHEDEVWLVPDGEFESIQLR